VTVAGDSSAYTIVGNSKKKDRGGGKVETKDQKMGKNTGEVLS